MLLLLSIGSVCGLGLCQFACVVRMIWLRCLSGPADTLFLSSWLVAALVLVNSGVEALLLLS